MHTQRDICKKTVLGAQTPILKKPRTDIVGFLIGLFRQQSTPLSAIRPLPVPFALFSSYLPTLMVFLTKRRIEVMEYPP